MSPRKGPLYKTLLRNSKNRTQNEPGTWRRGVTNDPPGGDSVEGGVQTSYKGEGENVRD